MPPFCSGGAGLWHTTRPQRHHRPAVGQLESVPVASPDELLALLQRRALFGRGCGFVDISLLASALLGDHTLLWTTDKRLAAVAAELGRAYRPALAA